MLRGPKDLKVYRASYEAAMQVFRASKAFPKEERYSLTDQIRRSSRSVSANLAEGFRKRRYEAAFVHKLTECDAEASETQVWLDFAFGCGYLPEDCYRILTEQYEEIGRMLGGMLADPAKFLLP